MSTSAFKEHNLWMWHHVWSPHLEGTFCPCDRKGKISHRHSYRQPDECLPSPSRCLCRVISCPPLLSSNCSLSPPSLPPSFSHSGAHYITRRTSERYLGQQAISPRLWNDLTNRRCLSLSCLSFSLSHVIFPFAPSAPSPFLLFNLLPILTASSVS